MSKAFVESLMRQFESWAKEEGMDIAFAIDQKSDAHTMFPASYLSESTERAWRAWSKKTESPVSLITGHVVTEAANASGVMGTLPQLLEFARSLATAIDPKTTVEDDEDDTSDDSGYQRDHRRAVRAIKVASEYTPELQGGGISPENAISMLAFMLVQVRDPQSPSVPTELLTNLHEWLQNVKIEDVLDKVKGYEFMLKVGACIPADVYATPNVPFTKTPEKQLQAELSRVESERKYLAQAIESAARFAGLVEGDQSLSFPYLMYTAGQLAAAASSFEHMQIESISGSAYAKEMRNLLRRVSMQKGSMASLKALFTFLMSGLKRVEEQAQKSWSDEEQKFIIETLRKAASSDLNLTPEQINFAADMLELAIVPSPKDTWPLDGYFDSKKRVHQMLLDEMKVLGLGTGERGWVEDFHEGKLERKPFTLEAELYFAFIVINEHIQAMKVDLSGLPRYDNVQDGPDLLSLRKVESGRAVMFDDVKALVDAAARGTANKT